MFDQIEPAAAARFADEVGAARQQFCHRMVEAAHQGAVDEQAIGNHGRLLSRRGGRDQANTTSSLTTRNFVSVMRPKLVVSATSAASRPVAIRMRPTLGWLWRASKVYHWPDR